MSDQVTELKSREDISSEDRRIMGSPEAAKLSLIERTREWRSLRQPVMGNRSALNDIDVKEREARFQLANAAALWLWHEENPTPIVAYNIASIEKILFDHFYTGQPGEHEAIKAATSELTKSGAAQTTGEQINDDPSWESEGGSLYLHGVNVFTVKLTTEQEAMLAKLVADANGRNSGTYQSHSSADRSDEALAGQDGGRGSNADRDLAERCLPQTFQDELRELRKRMAPLPGSGWKPVPIEPVHARDLIGNEVMVWETGDDGPAPSSFSKAECEAVWRVMVREAPPSSIRAGSERTSPSDADVAWALKTALGHIDHMAAWITKQTAGYSFESLGEDIHGLRETLERLAASPSDADAVRQVCADDGNTYRYHATGIAAGGDKNVLVLPVTRVELRSDEEPVSPQEDLLKRIGWAIDDCIDDEMPGIATILNEAKAEIIRRAALPPDDGRRG